MALFFDIAGLIGVACFLGSYFLLQAGRMGAADLSYLFLNLLGALLVMLSLTRQWNLSAFLLEAAWAAITLYGIARTIRTRRKGRGSDDR